MVSRGGVGVFRASCLHIRQTLTVCPIPVAQKGVLLMNLLGCQLDGLEIGLHSRDVLILRNASSVRRSSPFPSDRHVSPPSKAVAALTYHDRIRGLHRREVGDETARTASAPSPSSMTQVLLILTPREGWRWQMALSDGNARSPTGHGASPLATRSFPQTAIEFWPPSLTKSFRYRKGVVSAEPALPAISWSCCFFHLGGLAEDILQGYGMGWRHITGG